MICSPVDCLSPKPVAASVMCYIRTFHLFIDTGFNSIFLCYKKKNTSRQTDHFHVIKVTDSTALLPIPMVSRPPHNMVLDNHFDKHSRIKPENTELLKYAAKSTSKEKDFLKR